MKLPLLAVSLLLIGAQARAAVLYELDPEIRAKTMQLLAERNVNYREEAEKLLKGKGHFDRQRLEITGMLSADDTRRIAPADFDDYIKPSVKADKDRTIGDWFWSWKGRDYDRDMEEMKPAMRGEMTERAIKTVAAYRNLEINEIVAHSWGSQLIYAAILNGEMRPPKKLIVLGVPDDDRAKWALLAARTGTEVFWGRAGNDAAALDKGVKIAKEAAKNVDFETKWDAACADKEKNICLPHGRRPQPVVEIPIGNLPVRPLSPGSYLGHDRADYYDLVRAKGFFKGTAKELTVADNKRVVREMKKLEQETVNATHEEARKLIEAARAQKAIAERDHDERLRRTLADMATRSCASPGILTQSELDALPDPYNKSFVDSPPGGLDSCAFMLYLRLGRGADADEIRQYSIPPRPIDVDSPPSLIPARPAPPSAAISPNPRTPFSAVLPGLKVLAETACSAPGRASVDESLIRPRMPFSFAGERDDHAAANLSTGLGDCPRQLFHKLIEMIRSGKEAEITNIWIRDMAAVYSRPAYSRPVYVAPPWSGGDPCRDNGNIRCP